MTRIELLTSGKYEFRISDVLSFDREGRELKTKNNMAYKKIRLSVLDKDGSIKHVYDPVFNSKKMQQILRCVGKVSSPDLDVLEELIGTGGECFIDIRKGREGYNDQNVVDCYIQKEDLSNATQPQLTTSTSHLEPEQEDVPW